MDRYRTCAFRWSGLRLCPHYLPRYGRGVLSKSSCWNPHQQTTRGLGKFVVLGCILGVGRLDRPGITADVWQQTDAAWSRVVFASRQPQAQAIRLFLGEDDIDCHPKARLAIARPWVFNLNMHRTVALASCFQHLVSIGVFDDQTITVDECHHSISSNSLPAASASHHVGSAGTAREGHAKVGLALIEQCLTSDRTSARLPCFCQSALDCRCWA